MGVRVVDRALIDPGYFVFADVEQRDASFAEYGVADMCVVACRLGRDNSIMGTSTPYAPR